MREIIYSHEFDCAADEIGFERVDIAIETVVEGLYKNPYGFELFESDIVSFRWVTIEGVPECPPLFIVFQILENRDVELTHVEILE